MVEDPEKVLEQMRPFLQWNVGADLLFKELQHCLAPDIQKAVKLQIKQEGNQVAVETILNQLVCADDWPSQLYRALLSPSINRPKLARKLKCSKMENVDSTESDSSLLSKSDSDCIQTGALKKLGRCTGKTKVKNLPTAFLSKLKEDLDVKDGWKLLAVQLGYSTDDVAYIGHKDGSPTEHLILHWIQEHPDAAIDNIFSSLQMMEYKSLLKELRKISEYSFESMDGESSDLVKPPISIPNFNPVPDLSIDESLKKGEHVSPTISPMIPRKAVITQMNMPKYTDSIDEECNSSTSESVKEDRTVPFSESSLEPAPSTQSPESLNYSFTSGISNHSNPSGASINVECSSAYVSEPQMADSGFVECTEVKNQDSIGHSNDLPAFDENVLLFGSSGKENDAPESTLEFLQDGTTQIEKEVSSKMVDSGFMECTDVKNQDSMEHSDNLGKNSLHLSGTNDGDIESKNTSEILQDTKQQLMEEDSSEMFESSNAVSDAILQDKSINPTLETIDISLSEPDTEPDCTDLKSGPILSKPIQNSHPEPQGAHSYSEGSDQIGNEPEMELEVSQTELEPEVKTAKLFVEHILESAFTQHLATHSSSSEPEIISSALVGHTEYSDIEETEADFSVGSQESALDNEAVLSNPEEVQIGFASKESEPLSTSQTILEIDAKMTQREDPDTFSEVENLTVLSEKEEKEEAMNEGMEDLLENANVSQSENDSEISFLKAALQDTREQIDVPSEIAGNSIIVSNINSGSMPTMPAVEISYFPSDFKPDDKNFNTELVVPDETLGSFDSELMSDSVVSEANRITESNISDVLPDIVVPDKLAEKQISCSEPGSSEKRQIVVQDSTESLSEIQPEMVVLNLTELASFMLISDTFNPRTVSEDSISACTMDLEDSVIAVDLESSENTVSEMKGLSTLPEIEEDTEYDLQEIGINSMVKLGTSRDSLDAIEIIDAFSEEKTVLKEDNVGVKDEEADDMELSPQASEVSISNKDSDIIPRDEVSSQQFICNEEKSAVEKDTDSVKGEKEIHMESSSQVLEVSIPSKDADIISLDGITLQQFIPNVEQISSEEISEKFSGKSRITYNQYGYLVLGMAMVGSGMLLWHKYWK